MLFKGRRAEPLAVQEQEPTGVLVTSGELLDHLRGGLSVSDSRSQLRTAEQLLRDISLALVFAPGLCEAVAFKSICDWLIKPNPSQKQQHRTHLKPSRRKINHYNNEATANYIRHNFHHCHHCQIFNQPYTILEA